jgi:hypothetical protein
MSTTFVAHPTTYRGTEFRSRLEARWAAFFDLLAWRWEYEPFDMYGWVPDFTVTGAGNNTLLVEVKPFILTSESHDSPEIREIETKINRALLGSEWESLLVGAYPFIWTGDTFFGPMDALCCGMVCDRRSFAAFVGNLWGGYRLVTHDGTNELDIRDMSEVDDLRLLWAEAGNVTRWRK